MNIDLDPDKNRTQFQKMRKYSVRHMVLSNTGFYYLLGSILTLFGMAAIFAMPGTFQIQGYLNQTETGMVFAGAGVSMVVACKLVSLLMEKKTSYKPQPNTGDEWNS
ncbi:MAG: hypothetical protein ABJ308_15715 [Halieaceae bacterium]